MKKFSQLPITITLTYAQWLTVQCAMDDREETYKSVKEISDVNKLLTAQVIKGMNHTDFYKV